MHGNEPEYQIVATKKQIAQLVNQKKLEQVNHNAIPPGPDGKTGYFLKVTWTLKLKILPEGSNLKYKALYCVYVNLQTADVEYFKTHAPVVQYSTISLSLTMIIYNNWNTKQVYSTNEFYQPYLKEEFYIDPTHGFEESDGI